MVRIYCGYLNISSSINILDLKTNANLIFTPQYCGEDIAIFDSIRKFQEEYVKVTHINPNCYNVYLKNFNDDNEKKEFEKCTLKNYIDLIVDKLDFDYIIQKFVYTYNKRLNEYKKVYTELYNICGDIAKIIKYFDPYIEHLKKFIAFFKTLDYHSIHKKLTVLLNSCVTCDALSLIDEENIGYLSYARKLRKRFEFKYRAIDIPQECVVTYNLDFINNLAGNFRYGLFKCAIMIKVDKFAITYFYHISCDVNKYILKKFDKQSRLLSRIINFSYELLENNYENEPFDIDNNPNEDPSGNSSPWRII